MVKAKAKSKPTDSPSVIQLRQASLKLAGRWLWHDLDLAVKAGEFIAILGPNGSGKTSLLKVLLGLQPLNAGIVTVHGRPPRRGNPSIGYIPQQKSFDAGLPIRGRDLVRLGITGYHYGFGYEGGRSQLEAKVQQAIDAVGAASYADLPIGLLSGGEQQRLRIAQALVSQPSILLCDEPLLSLDLASQQSITKLIQDYRTASQAAVLFVTHEVNPVLPWVDRILYLANGRWVVDTPDKVLHSKTLSELYDTRIDVLRVRGRVLVVGAEDVALTASGAHHTHEGDIGDVH